MLGGRQAATNGRLSGQVPSDTCFRICMDYFNDEVWKAEDEEEKKKKTSGKGKPVTAKCSVSDVDDDDDVETGATENVPPATKPVPTNKKKQEEGQLDFFAMMGMK